MRSLLDSLFNTSYDIIKGFRIIEMKPYMKDS